MGRGSYASLHWALGVWSDDRGITRQGKGGPPNDELRHWRLPVGTSAGPGLTVRLVCCHKSHSHWLRVLRAKAFIALTWELLHSNTGSERVNGLTRTHCKIGLRPRKVTTYIMYMIVVVLSLSENTCAYKIVKGWVTWWKCCSVSARPLGELWTTQPNNTDYTQQRRKDVLQNRKLFQTTLTFWGICSTLFH